MEVLGRWAFQTYAPVLEGVQGGVESTPNLHPGDSTGGQACGMKLSQGVRGMALGVCKIASRVRKFGVPSALPGGEVPMYVVSQWSSDMPNVWHDLRFVSRGDTLSMRETVSLQGYLAHKKRPPP